MQTSKAMLSPEHQTSAMPAAREAVTPTVSSPSTLSLTSRPARPPLFPGDEEALAILQSGNAAQSTSPEPREGDLSTASDEKKSQDPDSAAASTAASGTKRARDGKDGPAKKQLKADRHDQPKPSRKPLARDGEASNPDDAGSNAQRPSKRARKGSNSSKGTQSGKAHRSKSVDQGTSQTGALSPTAKVTCAPTLSPDSTLSGSDAVSPVTWKHGAQSPRANSGSRISLTLAPRRSSNASAIERVSPATQGENPVAGQQAKAPISAFATLFDDQGFTFAACDSDEEGVIHGESGSTETLPGKAAQTASLAGRAVASPGSAAGHGAEPTGGATEGQQNARQLPRLTSDMTALLDDLDAALDKPIGM
ncbi:MAG: hypothetical protein ACJ8G3_26470 [Burkholderiaceae bacterium]